MNNSARRLTLIFCIGMLLTLTACGGGGGGGSSSGAAPPNNWDSMVWDQGNWG